METTLLPLLLLLSPVIQVSQPFLTMRPTTLSLKANAAIYLGVLAKATDRVYGIPYGTA
jgi:hypothetical protein